MRSQTQAKCLPMNTGQESRGRKLLATAGGKTRKPCFSLAIIAPDSVVQALGSPVILGLFFGSPLSLKLSMALKKEDGLQGQWAQGLLLGTQVCCAQGSMEDNICWCHLAQETCHEDAGTVSQRPRAMPCGSGRIAQPLITPKSTPQEGLLPRSETGLCVPLPPQCSWKSMR